MDTTLIVVDRIGAIAIMNGVLRIECMAVNAAGQEKASGTLLIPANVAAAVVQSLVTGMQELERKVRDATAAVPPAARPSY
jgi:hypothetical protein